MTAWVLGDSFVMVLEKLTRHLLHVQGVLNMCPLALYIVTVLDCTISFGLHCTLPAAQNYKNRTNHTAGAAKEMEMDRSCASHDTYSPDESCPQVDP